MAFKRFEAARGGSWALGTFAVVGVLAACLPSFQEADQAGADARANSEAEGGSSDASTLARADAAGDAGSLEAGPTEGVRDATGAGSSSSTAGNPGASSGDSGSSNGSSGASSGSGSSSSSSPGCGVGEFVCDGGYASLAGIHSCGACGNDCTALPHVSLSGLACNAGHCSYECAVNYDDCVDAGTGCTTALSQSSSCGACGASCGPNMACTESDGGVYGCASTCSGATPTPCDGGCIDKLHDNSNCGSCGLACTGGKICAGGSCINQLAASGDDVSATAGMAFGGAVATVTDALATDGAGALSAIVDWGDGTTSAGTIDGAGPFTVSATHTYATPGSPTIRVNVSDSATGATATASATATVGCPATEGACGSGCFATATDPDHCGSNCKICPAPANGQATCTNSACGVSCNGGYHDCSGACTSNTALSSCGSSCVACASPTNAMASCNGQSCQYTCTSGYAACGASAAGGCTTNLSSDTNNCGACGHSCGGGTCTGGLCAAVTILSGQGTVGTPMALACDGTNVYWSDWDGVLGDADEIRQATVAGTDVLTLDGQAVADVNSIAVEGTTVAYMAQSGAYFCAATVSHSQSGACSLALGEGPAGGWVVSASANSFYELSAFDTIGPTYEVSSCAGLACTALPGVGEAQSAISLAYVPGSSALFWVAANEINYWNVAASLQGMVAPVTSDEVNPALLTSDGTYLYWIDSGTTIKRVLASPSIGTPSTVAGPLALPAQNPNSSIGVNDWIATDGKNVFFGATGPNGVGLYAAPVGGGAPILVAGALSTSPPALTIQYGGWLYWFENATLPVIRRMATP